MLMRSACDRPRRGTSAGRNKPALWYMKLPRNVSAERGQCDDVDPYRDSEPGRHDTAAQHCHRKARFQRLGKSEGADEMTEPQRVLAVEEER